MPREFVLRECQYASPCVICENSTCWSLVDEDIHICGQECFIRADEEGLLDIVKRSVAKRENVQDGGGDATNDENPSGDDADDIFGLVVVIH